MKSTKSEAFTLEPVGNMSAAQPWFPKNLLRLELATPLEESVTVIAVVKSREGDARIPISWSPVGQVTKRMNRSTWEEVGLTEHVHRIRQRAEKIARSEYRRRVNKYATLDLFNPD